MTRSTRWPVLAGAFFALLTAGLLAYLVYSAITDLRPRHGGIFREGVVGSPMALNPLLSQFNDADKDLVALIFSGLTRLARDGQVIPDLAAEWSISPDGRQYTFRLRPEVQWHDGTSFTADDVVFTFQTIQHPEFPGSPDLADFWRTVSVEKVDDHTVRFTLLDSFAPFLSYTTMGILPMHLLREVPAKDLPKAPFNAEPVGTGPFRVAQTAVDHIRLQSNPFYHRGEPYLETIELRFYHDEQAALAALGKGEVQGVFLHPVVPPETMAALQKNKRLRFHTSQRSSYTLIFFNWRLPLFQKKEVRQALLYGLDREKIVRDAVGGQGLVASGPIPPQAWAYHPILKTYPYNPEKAQEILRQAGWEKEGKEVWEKDGQELRFVLMTNNDKTRIAIGEEVIRQLRRIGVRAELAASGPTGLLQNFVIPRRFQAVLYGFDTGYDPDPYPVWHSSQDKENGLNISSFSNKEIDSLLEQARTTVDQEERKRLYREFQSAFAEELPALLLYYPASTYVVDKDVRGIEMGVLFEPSSRFVDVREWHIRTRRVLQGLGR